MLRVIGSLTDKTPNIVWTPCNIVCHRHHLFENIKLSVLFWPPPPSRACLSCCHDNSLTELLTCKTRYMSNLWHAYPIIIGSSVQHLQDKQSKNQLDVQWHIPWSYLLNMNTRATQHMQKQKQQDMKFGKSSSCFASACSCSCFPATHCWNEMVGVASTPPRPVAIAWILLLEWSGWSCMHTTKTCCTCLHGQAALGLKLE